MVVLILVALWVAALAPLGWRRLRERQGTASIESFHQQLHLLGRAGPKIMAPAHRLQTAFSHTGVAPGQTGYPPVPATPSRRPDLVLVASSGPSTISTPAAGPDRPGRGHGVEFDPAHLTGWAAREAKAAQRRRGRRRRRDLVLSLSLLVVLTGSLGALHGLHLLWLLTAVGVLGLCACVGLAAYAQFIEADQQALRPVTADSASAPWDQDQERRRPDVAAGADGGRHAAARHSAARAGFPGAWDDDVPRAAAGG